MGRLPVATDFPPNATLTIVPPPDHDAATNVLVLLHGLGDTHHSFAQLARQMNLPETACLSVQAPQALLDLPGFHWGDDVIFDSSDAGLDADAGFKGASALLKIILQDVLMQKCGYRARELMLFGFGQGGMAALSVVVSMHLAATAPATAELGGVISIGAALSQDTPATLSPASRTPVLVCAGTDRSSVTPSAESKLQHLFAFVDVKRYRRPGDGMPSNRDEMLPIMQFFSRRLRSVKGVPPGSLEVAA